MSTSWRTRVIMPLAALLLLCFASPHTTYARASGSHSGFRLGTAAGAFGPSAAIADFDSDAKPDFAIADRISSGSQGYTYTLEVGLSFEKSQVFHFRSPHSALTVSVLDLDNDKDLDVVLTHALTGDVVGVWINNGRGQFHQGNADDFPHAVPSNGQHRVLDSLHASLSIPGLPLRKCSPLGPGPNEPGCLTVPSRKPVESLKLRVARNRSHYWTSPRAPPVSILS